MSESDRQSRSTFLFFLFFLHQQQPHFVLKEEAVEKKKRERDPQFNFGRSCLGKNRGKISLHKKPERSGKNKEMEYLGFQSVF